MKNFVILILIALLFIWIEKMTKNPENPNKTAVKSEYSAVSQSDEKTLTPATPPAKNNTGSSRREQTSSVRQNTVSQTTGDYTVKAQLDALAGQILTSAENHDNSGMQVYVQKMAALGVTEMCQPRVLQKQTPTCPPVKIKVNGVEKSGSLCALTCYKYKGREYEIGYCK